MSYALSNVLKRIGSDFSSSEILSTAISAYRCTHSKVESWCALLANRRAEDAEGPSHPRRTRV